MLLSLDLHISDPITMQSVFQQLFENSVIAHFASLSSHVDTQIDTSELTFDDLNVLRYACGFVAHSLLKKFDKRKGQKYALFVDCIGEIAVAGDGENVLEYTRKWFDIVNRGGLFPLNDNAFSLFVEIEKIVRRTLPKHVLSGEKDKQSFRTNVHEKVKDSEEVQFYWCLLSPDIDNHEQSQELLSEIITLWVTVRGFSLTASWMEEFKNKVRRSPRV